MGAAVRGDWFFALTPDGEVYNEVLHRRRDIDADGVDIVEQEAAGRRMIAVTTDLGDPCLVTLKTYTWCHASRERADGTLQLMGTGFIDPIAIQAQDEDTVSIEIYCSPRDWNTLQAAALAPLKLQDGFDPVLVPIENRNNAVDILDGFSRVLHCHPVTHQFTVVDIFGVGLPVTEIADPDFPGPQPDAMTRPVAAVQVSVKAEWIEARDGGFDVTNVVNGEFDEDLPNTLTPDAFEGTWFQPGSSINGDSGYTVRRSQLEPILPEDRPDLVHVAGPVHGSSGIYNYVTDQNHDAPEPQAMTVDRVYYNAELSIDWKVRQKRVETVRFTILNGAPTAAGGAVEVLDLVCEDITRDDVTLPWLPNTAQAAGSVRRVGSQNWKCVVNHISSSSFAGDLMYIVGGVAMARWTREATDHAPIGSRGSSTYFLQPRGRQTTVAAAMKARAIIAASLRNRPFRLETELTDDLLSLTTASRVRVPLLDGTWIEAKVTELEIISSPDDEYLAITISPAGGSGTPVAGADVVSQTGEAWDRISFGGYAGQMPDLMPAVGGTLRVTNTVEEQLEYVQARDYAPAEGRDDPKLTDPVELLKAVPTSIRLALTQISGRDAMEHEINIPVTAPWSGPKQHEV